MLSRALAIVAHFPAALDRPAEDYLAKEPDAP